MRARKGVRSMILVAAVAALGAFVARAAPSAQPAAEEEKSAECCVTNPAFAGVCRVELGPDETCADVLEYLNNPASVGKTYCGTTNIREGWKQAACDDEEEDSAGASALCAHR